MIKAVGESGDKRFLLIGLSMENCRRLLRGEPIMFDLPAPLDPESKIIMLGGETEEAIVAELREAGWLDGTVEYRPDTDPDTAT